jgi:Uma2 family endonuclease
MSPAPSRAHHAVLGELFAHFREWLKDKPCQVYLAPFDVLLPSDPDQAENEVDTVVQPDLSVFCDPARLTDAGARGAPDLVVEILSPWTIKKDLNEKGQYDDPEILVKTESVASAVLEGFRVDVEALFTL